VGGVFSFLSPLQGNRRFIRGRKAHPLVSLPFGAAPAAFDASEVRFFVGVRQNVSIEDLR